MLFVIEGPDYAGKTTFSVALRALLEKHDPLTQVSIVHTVSPTPQESLDLAHTYYEKASQVTGSQHTIFDRLHIGELIYGPVFRSESLITVDDKKRIDELLVSRAAELIYLNPGETELMRRVHAGRGDDLVKDDDQLIDISRSYDRLLLNDTNWRHVQNTEEELEKIEARLYR